MSDCAFDLDHYAELLEAAKAGGGRIITSQLNEQD